MSQNKRTEEMQKKILAGILVVATLLLAVSFVYLSGTSLFRPALIFLLILTLVPLTATRYYNGRKKGELASNIPAFLSDLENALKSGLSHQKAVGALAAKDYGPLSHEIAHMKKEMHEGKTFEHSIRNLADRLAGTHAHHVLHNISGGGELKNASAHLKELETIEYMRRLKFQTYTLSLYALFLVFSVVVSLMGKTYPVGNLPLELIWIQALFTGTAAGKLAENSYLAGATHALSLLIIGTLPYVALSSL